MKKCEKIPKCVKKKRHASIVYTIKNLSTSEVACIYYLKTDVKIFAINATKSEYLFFLTDIHFSAIIEIQQKKLKLIPTMYIYSKWTDIFNLTWLLIGFMHKFNGQCILSTVIYHHLTYFFDIIVITLKAYYLPNVQPLNHPKWAYLTLRGH